MLLEVELIDLSVPTNCCNLDRNIGSLDAFSCDICDFLSSCRLLHTLQLSFGLISVVDLEIGSMNLLIVRSSAYPITTDYFITLLLN